MRIRISIRQRETIGKAFLNAANAILIAWVLSNIGGRVFRLSLFICGFSFYVIFTLLAVLVDR